MQRFDIANHIEQRNYMNVHVEERIGRNATCHYEYITQKTRLYLNWQALEWWREGIDFSVYNFTRFMSDECTLYQRTVDIFDECTELHRASASASALIATALNCGI